MHNFISVEEAFKLVNENLQKDWMSNDIEVKIDDAQYMLDADGFLVALDLNTEEYFHGGLFHEIQEQIDEGEILEWAKYDYCPC